MGPTSLHSDGGRTYYVAINADGSAVGDSSVQWCPNGSVQIDRVVHCPAKGNPTGERANEMIRAADSATGPINQVYPWRLLTVTPTEPVTDLAEHQYCPGAYSAPAWTITGEVPAHYSLGPQGALLLELAEAVRGLNADQRATLDEAIASQHERPQVLTAALDHLNDRYWLITHGVAQYAPEADSFAAAARGPAWCALWYYLDFLTIAGGRAAVWAAALGILAQDLISPTLFTGLTHAWQTLAHPDVAESELVSSTNPTTTGT